MSMSLKLKEFLVEKEEEVHDKDENEDDDDNILRKSSRNETNKAPKFDEFQDIEENQEEQLSIEIVDKEEENTRK